MTTLGLGEGMWEPPHYAFAARAVVTASNGRLDRLAGREEMNVGLSPPEETGDPELEVFGVARAPDKSASPREGR